MARRVNYNLSTMVRLWKKCQETGEVDGKGRRRLTGRTCCSHKPNNRELTKPVRKSIILLHYYIYVIFYSYALSQSFNNNFNADQ